MFSVPPGYPTVDFSRAGPSVGEPFPAIVLPDQHGHVVDLHADRGGRRAIVLFMRGAGW